MANNDPVFSLLKGLDLLRAVGESEGGMRLSDLAQQMGWKVPATHHLVRTLLMRDFLEKGTDGLLRLGPVAGRLGEQYLNSPHLAGVESRLLAIQGSLPQATVIYGVPDGAELRQTRRLSPDRPGVVQRLASDVLHPYASAGGLLAMAFANPEERLALEGRRPFAEHGQSLWKSREKLEAFLKACLKTGRAESPFDRELYTRVALALKDAQGHLTAVYGVSVPLAGGQDAGSPAVFKVLEAT